MSDAQKTDAQEKTIDPSPARLEKARREGDAPHSRETTAAATYLLLFVLVLTAAPALGIAFTVRAIALFDASDRYPASASADVSAQFIQFLTPQLAFMAGLFLLAPALGALGSIIAQRAVTFAPKKLKPKLSRISPIANAKKKFGPEGIVEFCKASFKLFIICIAFGTLIATRLNDLPSLVRIYNGGMPSEFYRQYTFFLGVIVLFSIGVALIDLPWTRFTYLKKLRMTREEAKKEQKENEGDPALKQKRRDKGRSIAENRMLLDVPKADAVIVNPTHYAVAIKWERTSKAAPICVAKGIDEMARRIREAAILSNVPIRPDPPTARAIWTTVEVGDEIKREHFKAVAAALIFAEKVRGQVSARDSV